MTSKPLPPADIRAPIDQPWPIKQCIVKAERLGWYCHTTWGIANVGEVPLYALTHKDIERKAARLARRLRRREAHQLAATELER